MVSDSCSVTPILFVRPSTFAVGGNKRTGTNGEVRRRRGPLSSFPDSCSCSNTPVKEKKTEAYAHSNHQCSPRQRFSRFYIVYFTGNRSLFFLFFCGTTAQLRLGSLTVEVSRLQTDTHNTSGRTPLNEWSARRTAHNKHKNKQCG